MIAFPKRYADRAARLRVPFGFVLVAAFACFSQPSVRSLMAGLPVSLAGLGLRAWAAGHLAKNRTLAQSGPYAYTRNPLYIGTLTVAAGLVIAGRSIWLGVIFAVVFLLIYLPVIDLEGQHLRNLFPEYANYAERVPALWPRLGNSSKRGIMQSDWNPEVYWHNREYQALLGFLAGAAWLFWLAGKR
ncbi:MAG: isoprenylcysteine carboxylmethyltransferase family protein [Acidobacteriota bacterium]|nr:isoprenylcysteine carboxylmethyltransferase family protein [Acidobacteriota bacterium]